MSLNSSDSYSGSVSLRSGVIQSALSGELYTEQQITLAHHRLIVAFPDTIHHKETSYVGMNALYKVNHASKNQILPSHENPYLKFRRAPLHIVRGKLGYPGESFLLKSSSAGHHG